MILKIILILKCKFNIITYFYVHYVSNFYCFSPINDTDIFTNGDDADDDGSLKLVSAKDFFDDEAELSESDWSSDDEDKLVGLNDKLEEEEGDKDKLDESLVKDGLDKIYMYVYKFIFKSICNHLI